MEIRFVVNRALIFDSYIYVLYIYGIYVLTTCCFVLRFRFQFVRITCPSNYTHTHIHTDTQILQHSLRYF